MDDLIIRILVMAIWVATVVWIVYAMATTEKASESEKSTLLEAAPERSIGYSVCFEDCLNDLLGNPNRVALCKRTCA